MPSCLSPAGRVRYISHPQLAEDSDMQNDRLQDFLGIGSRQDLGRGTQLYRNYGIDGYPSQMMLVARDWAACCPRPMCTSSLNWLEAGTSEHRRHHDQVGQWHWLGESFRLPSHVVSDVCTKPEINFLRQLWRIVFCHHRVPSISRWFRRHPARLPNRDTRTKQRYSSPLISFFLSLVRFRCLLKI